MRRLGVLVLLVGACSYEPSGTDEAADAGLDTSSGDSSSGAITESETEDGSPSCDYEALHDCEDPIWAAYSACAALCPAIVPSCSEAECLASCELERSSAELSCQAAHCTEPEQLEVCVHECWLESSSCIAEPDCDVHVCQWDGADCVTRCVHCIIPAELDFVFAGSCELALPEPLEQVQLPFTAIEIVDQTLNVDWAGTSCDSPNLGGTEDDGLLLLCPAACDAFTDVGLLRVVVGGPSCP